MCLVRRNMHESPGITIEASAVFGTCRHDDGSDHAIDPGELVTVQNFYKSGKGSQLFRARNSLCCVSPKQAKTILGGATSGGWPISMHKLGHAQYAVALAILEMRLEDRQVHIIHKNFRLG